MAHWRREMPRDQDKIVRRAIKDADGFLPCVPLSSSWLGIRNEIDWKSPTKNGRHTPGILRLCDTWIFDLSAWSHHALGSTLRWILQLSWALPSVIHLPYIRGWAKGYQAIPKGLFLKERSAEQVGVADNIAQ
ncbi:hypothetical protein Hypma_007872 [Hypsizygus marmoreus]|uniref:Uncharacterized protein n=1 Tax=Hypsizygus marmoreus TaxID=39966 RepID=A0A369JX53_HYPMA|nr:hypothetical protein Hypma_007872 [Hypsizygus marmoreus]